MCWTKSDLLWSPKLQRHLSDSPPFFLLSSRSIKLSTSDVNLLRCKIYLIPPIYARILKVASVLDVSQAKFYIYFLCFLCVFHAPPRVVTYSMMQSPSWEANWFAASQEIPHISQNPKVHYRTHKLPPLVSILGQPNPVHIPTSHLLEIHPNIIHPSTPRSPQWSLSLRFPHQDPIHPLSSPIRATCPAHRRSNIHKQIFNICILYF